MMILVSAVSSDGKVATSLVLIFSNVSFRRFLISPDSIFPLCLPLTPLGPRCGPWPPLGW